MTGRVNSVDNSKMPPIPAMMIQKISMQFKDMAALVDDDISGEEAVRRTDEIEQKCHAIIEKYGDEYKKWEDEIISSVIEKGERLQEQQMNAPDGNALEAIVSRLEAIENRLDNA